MMGDSSSELNPGGELRRVDRSSRAAGGSVHFFLCFSKKATIFYVPMCNSKGVALPYKYMSCLKHYVRSLELQNK